MVWSLVTQKAFKALQIAVLQAPTLSLPTGSEFVTEKNKTKQNRLWPHGLAVIVTIVLLMHKAQKFING